MADREGQPAWPNLAWPGLGWVWAGPGLGRHGPGLAWGDGRGPNTNPKQSHVPRILKIDSRDIPRSLFQASRDVPRIHFKVSRDVPRILNIVSRDVPRTCF